MRRVKRKVLKALDEIEESLKDNIKNEKELKDLENIKKTKEYIKELSSKDNQNKPLHQNKTML